MGKKALPQGICSKCGADGPIFDRKNNLCPTCAGKKGGRPRKNPPAEPPEPAEEPETIPDAWQDTTEPDETEEPEPLPETGGLWPVLIGLLIGAVYLFIRRPSPEA